MFRHYTGLFDTVEINNSFYRLPERRTFAAWREATPPDFVFSVKASRFLTHNKKLKDPEPALARLMEAAEGLGEKLGPILFQLPPHWKLNLERLEEFLEALPPRRRFTFEFREPSWNDDKVYRLLRRHNAACCIYELAGFQSPQVITADWAYVRLHGPGDKYQGSYSHARLASWAKQIMQWSRSMRAVYVYFDNDQAAYAAHNALVLKDMLQRRTQTLAG